MTTSPKSLTIQISSRLVLELMAGRITHEQFKDFAFGNNLNQFERELASGLTIHSTHLEKAGIDEDDDRLVFRFSEDPAAMPLRAPKT